MREPTTRYILLGALAAGGPMTGYDLRRWIDESVGDFWAESYGQIYPELRRLSAEGLVEPASNDGEGKPVQVTAAGREVLANWLGRQPRPERVRSELMLKLHFGRFLGTETAAGLVAGSLDRARRRLAELEQNLAGLRRGEVRGEALVFSLLVAERGLAVARADLQWAEQAAAAVAALEEGGPDEALRTLAT